MEAGYIEMVYEIDKSTMQAQVNLSREIAYKMRLEMVESARRFDAPTHWGGILSSVEILATLYGVILNCKEKKIDGYDVDKFLLSKGHAALALYSAMHQVGLLSDSQFETFQMNGSELSEIAEMNRTIGIEASGGSLGITPSYAIGLALLAKKKGYKYKVYFEVGDGELDEGSVWEALMAATQFDLDNLVMIVDRNGLQLDGNTDEIMSWSNLDERLRAFGWDTKCVDGHDCEELLKAFYTCQKSDRPKAIIANTIKGKGISFMENNYRWHDNHLKGKDLEMAREEIIKNAVFKF